MPNEWMHVRSCRLNEWASYLIHAFSLSYFHLCFVTIRIFAQSFGCVIEKMARVCCAYLPARQSVAVRYGSVAVVLWFLYGIFPRMVAIISFHLIHFQTTSQRLASRQRLRLGRGQKQLESLPRDSIYCYEVYTFGRGYCLPFTNGLGMVSPLFSFLLTYFFSYFFLLLLLFIE